MSAMLDAVIAQVLVQQVRLLACQARLAANTDSEALHDLRISVRRLRSLLRPLSDLPGVDQLEQAAAQVGQLTTPLRDREVLAAYLLKHDQADAAEQRLDHSGRAFASVAASPQLARLLAIVDAFPMFLRAAQREGLTQRLRQRVEKRLGKQWKRLDQAIHDPAHDRHRLRLLIKRLRYGAEAYPQLERLKPALAKALKRAQGDLGDWHDRLQWLLQAQTHSDLAPCVAEWRQQLAAAEQRGDLTLERLLEAMDSR